MNGHLQCIWQLLWIFNKSISWNLPRELVSDLLENTMFPKTEIKKLLKFPKGIKSKNISATSGK